MSKDTSLSPDVAGVVERLSEKIIADAYERGLITSGLLTERLIMERKDAASLLSSQAQEIVTLKRDLEMEERECEMYLYLAYPDPGENGARSWKEIAASQAQEIERLRSIRDDTIEECAKVADVERDRLGQLIRSVEGASPEAVDKDKP